jgi:organic hydroperoxide reductase OsmC/OhrA
MSDVFSTRLEWTGARSGGTFDPRTFSRDLSVSAGGQELPMSSAPAFHGDPARLNPEQLYVAAISACQALTYLALAAYKKVTVVGYCDDAVGWLEKVDGRMTMTRVLLRPRITLASGADETLARDLVERAHGQCFIGNSVTAAIAIEPDFQRVERSAA